MPNETAHFPLKEVTTENYGMYYVYPKDAFLISILYANHYPMRKR